MSGYVSDDDRKELCELLGVEQCDPDHEAALQKAARLQECNPQVALAVLLLGATNFSCECRGEDCGDEPTELVAPAEGVELDDDGCDDCDDEECDEDCDDD